MGFNTTVVVLNDALGYIEDDPEFGKKLAAAIREASLYSTRKLDENGYHKIVDVSAGNHVNAAHVVETHHADLISIIAVGGNLGQHVGPGGRWNELNRRETVLRVLADSLGYDLEKKPIPPSSRSSAG